MLRRDVGRAAEHILLGLMMKDTNLRFRRNPLNRPPPWHLCRGILTVGPPSAVQEDGRVSTDTTTETISGCSILQRRTVHWKMRRECSNSNDEKTSKLYLLLTTKVEWVTIHTNHSISVTPSKVSAIHELTRRAVARPVNEGCFGAPPGCPLMRRVA
jgi:hypothetical protein